MIWQSIIVTLFFFAEVLLFVCKLVVITYFIDAWLYWLHRAFHSERFPAWFRRWHMGHHVNFQRSKVFSLHPMELLLDTSAPFIFVSYLISPWFFIVVVLWGLFEAARGHGHFKWFRLIPASYYKFFDFCGLRYHAVHHRKGGESVNLGQMLRTWDRICGTIKTGT